MAAQQFYYAQPSTGFSPLIAGELIKSVALGQSATHFCTLWTADTPLGYLSIPGSKKNPSKVDPPPESQLACFGEVYLFQFVSKNLDFLFIFVFLLGVLQEERKKDVRNHSGPPYNCPLQTGCRTGAQWDGQLRTKQEV